MNYIKHLNKFYDKIYYDTAIAPSQIALFLALFQCWNKQRFQNPIYINRDEVMRLSKITSNTTYHRSMNILHENGYIIYEPSFSPYKGSKIYFTDLTHSNTLIHTTSKNDKEMKKAIEKVKQNTSSKNGEAMEKAMEKATGRLYIDINNKHINNKLSLSEERENCSKKNEKNIQIENKILNQNSNKKLPPKEKSSAKKEKVEIPTLDEVKEFFQEKNGSPLEAEKFFNYYEATGWLVGGKSKMKKWRAAASNWIINAKASSLNVFGQQKPLDTSKDKRYDEPL